jgi:hypothetical protein
VCKVLEGRNVILFPDLGSNCYELWRLKAAEIRSSVHCRIHVSDLLEKNASDEQRINGCDLADFLLSQDCDDRPLYNRKLGAYFIETGNLNFKKF